MREYRDELAAAHERIAALERELASKPKPPQPPKKSAVVPVLTMAAMAGGLMVMAFAGAHRHRSSYATRFPPVVAPAVTPVVYEPPLGVTWYPQSGVGPIVTDVDSDGVEDTVGLYWRTARPSNALSVVALSGATFRPIWHADDLPSQWYSGHTHLVKAGEHLLLSDTQAHLHVLDVHTGAQSASWPLGEGVRSLCPLADGSGRVVMSGDSADDLRVLDPLSGAFSKPAKTAHCLLEVPACERAQDAGVTCTSDRHVRGRKASVIPYATLEEGDFVLTRSSQATGTGTMREYGVGASRATRSVLWESMLQLEDDTPHYGVAQTRLVGGRIVVLYQLKNGPFRLLAREAATGKVLWSTIVPSSAEGSTVSSLTVTPQRVYVPSDSRLHVFSADNGLVIRTVATL
jgi:hypothetical protein